MIAILRLLFPSLLSIFGGVGLAALTGGGFIIWNRLIDNPGIIREQRAICVAEVEAAAAKATREEQARQFRISEAATQQALQEEAREKAEHEANIGKLTERIKVYEAQRVGEGRACPLSDGDIEFLLRD